MSETAAARSEADDAGRGVLARAYAACGACEWCVRRAGGDQASSIAADIVTRASEEGAAAAEAQEEACSVCCGVLEAMAARGGAWEARAAAAAAAYDRPTVALGVRVPVSVAVRERGAALHAGRDVRAAVTAVKDVAREAAAALLGRASGKRVIGSGAQGAHEALAFEVVFLVDESRDSDVSRLLSSRAAAAAGGRQRSSQLQRQTGRSKRRRTAAPAPAGDRRLLGKGGLASGAADSLHLFDADLMRRFRLCPPARARGNTRADTAFQVRSPSVLVGGRYRKLARGVSHSPWPGAQRDSSADDGGGDGDDRKDDDDSDGALDATSVQCEIEGPLARLFGHAGGVKFMSSGREDRDVRMLGDGRPFVMELLDPRRTLCLADAGQAAAALRSAAAETAARGLVELEGLRVVSRAERDELNRGVGNKRKKYRCVVYSSRPLPAGGAPALAAALGPAAGESPCVILQKTPLRVAHRRAMMTREREVRVSHVEPLNQRWFLMDLETSAGTYVKEFVHGDRGRTRPSVASLLGCRCDILQLDVADLIL